MSLSVPDRIHAARDLLTTRPALVDALLVTALTVVVAVARLGEPLPAEPARTALLLAALLGQTLPMAWHRSRPWLVAAVVGAAYLVGEVADPLPDFDNSVPIVLAVYVVARRTPAPGSAIAIVLLPVVVTVPELVRWQAIPAVLAWPEGFVVVTAAVATWLVGTYQRRIHTDAARLRDLAARLSAEQELSARRAVTAERARIAHNLHDLVAHHVSAIAMQARVTADLLSEDPAKAGRGVAAIGETADAALTEMRRLLRLLAEEDEGGLRPEPSLRYLTRLTEGAEAAGAKVRMTIAPLAGTTPDAVQAAAYWVAREALTNALRHAGPTDVVIDVALHDHELTVVVDNGPSAPGHVPLPGSGIGLVGMRERTALFGGTLTAGPHPNGGWRVRATFQLEDPP